ncbi:Sec-independent protein translocase subunit TatA [Massilia sp. PAMC28688]|uniref:Sec-independent protein translocase subunit TatA n=1 Tax=Massilia sp. PAMC28688 TaxID=2861283 RepID=UPI001C62FBFB|nr:Sec-independent protein translocase subunit TatA [Massilia sp. PAMC28688]QYF95345.1 Sec-independent protein translocase subunit TatA [Massilia sp. PAMC28688]
MGSTSWIHWVILLVVVVLIFGTKKLGNMGGDIGKAVKGFKDGVKGHDDEAKPVPPQQVADKTVIDVESKEKSKL